jgi:hypothetical protein
LNGVVRAVSADTAEEKSVVLAAVAQWLRRKTVKRHFGAVFRNQCLKGRRIFPHVSVIRRKRKAELHKIGAHPRSIFE